MIGQVEYPPGVDFDISDCVDHAILLAKENGDYQKLIDAGYDDIQIRGVFADECIKNTPNKNEDSVKGWLIQEYTYSAERYKIIGVTALVSIGCGIIGYLIGASRA